MELNNILEKISKKVSISSKEVEFLGKYESISDEELKDFRMLSLHSAFDKIGEIMEKGKKVICNLIDRDGQINIEIKSLYSDYEKDKYILTLKHDEIIELKDNYLYNIIYNLKRDNYSLESSDEFVEKLTVKNED
jgi:hypothetical protein